MEHFLCSYYDWFWTIRRPHLKRSWKRFLAYDGLINWMKSFQVCIIPVFVLEFLPHSASCSHIKIEESHIFNRFLISIIFIDSVLSKILNTWLVLCFIGKIGKRWIQSGLHKDQCSLYHIMMHHHFLQRYTSYSVSIPFSLHYLWHFILLNFTKLLLSMLLP